MFNTPRLSIEPCLRHEVCFMGYYHNWVSHPAPTDHTSKLDKQEMLVFTNSGLTEPNLPLLLTRNVWPLSLNRLFFFYLLPFTVFLGTIHFYGTFYNFLRMPTFFVKIFIFYFHYLNFYIPRKCNFFFVRKLIYVQINQCFISFSYFIVSILKIK